jgi:hypothetical protein
VIIVGTVPGSWHRGRTDRTPPGNPSNSQVDQNCGGPYVCVDHAIHPRVGFFVAGTIVVGIVLGLVSDLLPLGPTLLGFLGLATNGAIGIHSTRPRRPEHRLPLNGAVPPQRVPLCSQHVHWSECPWRASETVSSLPPQGVVVARPRYFGGVRNTEAEVPTEGHHDHLRRAPIAGERRDHRRHYPDSTTTHLATMPAHFLQPERNRTCRTTLRRVATTRSPPKTLPGARWDGLVQG